MTSPAHHSSLQSSSLRGKKGSSTSSSSHHHHQEDFLSVQSGHNSYHLHHHRPTGVTTTDLFDDSCSSLSSTPSSTTTITTTSSSSSSSDSCGDLLPQLSSLDHHQHKPGTSSKSSSGKTAKASSKHSSHHSSHKSYHSNQEGMNDLNLGSPSKTASSSRRHKESSSKKSSSNTCTMNDSGTETTSGNTRNSTPSVGSENWTTFHFGPNEGMTHPTNDIAYPGHHLMTNTLDRMSPRTASEHYASLASLDHKMKTATLGSSTTSSPNKTKAVAIIKGTASVSRLSSNSFNHGSSSSGASSDWKKHLHSHEIRKLKRELDQSNEKVSSLTSQLATHSHMVTAFEQSLASMSLRLQQLQSLSGQKDCEITRLKNKVEELKMMQRFTPNPSASGSTATPPCTPVKSSKGSSCKSKQKNKSDETDNRSDVMNMNQSEQLLDSPEKDQRCLMIRRHAFVSSSESKGASKEGRWFRAFRRRPKNKSSPTASCGSVSDNEGSESLFNRHERQEYNSLNSGRMGSFDSFSQMGSTDGLNLQPVDASVVSELKRQLREKEKTVTDLRLEALTSAHQLQSLEETVSQLRSEVSSLKNENNRLVRQLSFCSHERMTPTSTGGGTTEKRLGCHHQHQQQQECKTGCLESRTNETGSGTEWTSSSPSSGEDQAASSSAVVSSSSGYASLTSMFHDSH